MRSLKAALVVLFVLFAAPAMAQRIDGDLRGDVKDPTGAVVLGAKVTVTGEATGISREVTSTSVGTYFVGSLLPGLYTVSVEASGFKRSVRRGVEVFANRVSEASISLELGAVAEVVEVVAGAERVTTTTATLVGATYKDELGSATVYAGTLSGNPINLAVTAPGTTTQPGGMAGTGGAIGGNRPRQNNFVIDGLDNNSPSVTGPLTPVIADAVEEFTLLTNQFTAEYGHSTAGQFLITTKSGTNDIHGRAWLFVQNRKLNALDNLRRSTTPAGAPKPNFDWQRFGAQAGGPILRDKWFIFGSYERQELDLAAVAGRVILVPTAAGLSSLQSLAGAAGSGMSPVNVGVIQAHVPTAATATATRLVCNEALAPSPGECTTAGAWQVTIPVGTFQATTPNFTHGYRYLISNDVLRGHHRFSSRFSFSRDTSVGAGALPVPTFNHTPAIDSYRFTFSDVFNLSPTVLVETRAAYLRLTTSLPIPGLPPAPGATDIFGNYDLRDMGLIIGPQTNLPQASFTNIYQLTNNWTFVRGPHTLKFGAEFRKIIAASDFLPRMRGEYGYVGGVAPGTLSSLDAFVRDFFPAAVAIRGVGQSGFSQNREAFSSFLQDSWKLHPRFTLELGVRYEFTTVARDSALQNLNGLANAASLVAEVFTPALITRLCSPRPVLVPATLCSPLPVAGENIFARLPARHQQALQEHVGNQVIFREPRPDANNIAPRIGFAWDLFGDGKTSLRGGAAIAYDVIFGNLPLLQLPPQVQAENRETNACVLTPSPAWCAVAGADPRSSIEIRFAGTGFIEGGALLPVLPGIAFVDALVARAATGNFIPHNEISPETYTWSLALQRDLFNRLLVEARYVGTAGRHLPTQRWLNADIPNPFRLPTFASTSEVPSSFAGQPTLATFAANRGLLLTPFGFFGVLTQFTLDSRSAYHGGSVSVRGNVGHGLFINSNYTFSKTIDNIENELFTSFMNPRRPFNQRNIFADRGLSGIHRKHKFVVNWSWNVPAYAGDNRAFRGVTRGWKVSGSFLAESGQPLTILAFRDLNGDFDTAGDRAFFNPAGTRNTGTDTRTVCWDGTTVTFGCAVTAQIVGYVAINPNAQYVQPGTGGSPAGSLRQLGRGTFISPGINTWNISLSKDTPFWGEGRSIRFQADFINAFNHPSFTIGSGSVFGLTGRATGSAGYVIPNSPLFLDKTIFSGGLGQSPFQRVIQLSLKVLF